jgi:hypothetical protein
MEQPPPLTCVATARLFLTELKHSRENMGSQMGLLNGKLEILASQTPVAAESA